MKTKYQNARNRRREAITKTGRFRGGRLNPVMAVAVKGSEGGMLMQTLTMELDPIPGRLITPITGEMVSVFVPVQAMDEISNPAAAYAGMTEVVRETLLSGTPLFGLEGETDISRRIGIEPRRVNKLTRVSSAVRLAHNAAVNFLRRRKFHKATLLLASNLVQTPALLGQTVLQRLNGVLDPDDRVNGAVTLDVNVTLPAAELDVKTDVPFAGSPGGYGYVETEGGTGKRVGIYDPAAGFQAAGHLYAQLNSTVMNGGASNVSLVDFYNAESMDRLTRQMDQIIKDNPVYGEEMVLRWAHGLSVDTGKTPFVLAERSAFFQRNIVGAMDTTGVNTDVIRSDFMMQMQISVPIPKTELGGIIVTFAVVKPDETLPSQPHPILSDVWTLDNYVADELALDPVPVTGRELDSNIAQALENTVMLYTGHNALKQMYVHYGFTRNTDPATVAAKTAIWQLSVPLSVTPDSVIYPTNLAHTPFADTAAEVCTYTIASSAIIDTPMIFGPTPVETIAAISAENLFEGN